MNKIYYNDALGTGFGSGIVQQNPLPLDLRTLTESGDNLPYKIGDEGIKVMYDGFGPMFVQSDGTNYKRGWYYLKYNNSTPEWVGIYDKPQVDALIQSLGTIYKVAGNKTLDEILALDLSDNTLKGNVYNVSSVGDGKTTGTIPSGKSASGKAEDVYIGDQILINQDGKLDNLRGFIDLTAYQTKEMSNPIRESNKTTVEDTIQWLYTNQKDTTYTFENGDASNKDCFFVTPSNGTRQKVTIVPSGTQQLFQINNSTSWATSPVIFENGRGITISPKYNEEVASKPCIGINISTQSLGSANRIVTSGTDGYSTTSQSHEVISQQTLSQLAESSGQTTDKLLNDRNLYKDDNTAIDLTSNANTGELIYIDSNGKLAINTLQTYGDLWVNSRSTGMPKLIAPIVDKQGGFRYEIGQTFNGEATNTFAIGSLLCKYNTNVRNARNYKYVNDYVGSSNTINIVRTQEEVSDYNVYKDGTEVKGVRNYYKLRTPASVPLYTDVINGLASINHLANNGYFDFYDYLNQSTYATDPTYRYSDDTAKDIQYSIHNIFERGGLIPYNVATKEHNEADIISMFGPLTSGYIVQMPMLTADKQTYIPTAKTDGSGWDYNANANLTNLYSKNNIILDKHGNFCSIGGNLAACGGTYTFYGNINREHYQTLFVTDKIVNKFNITLNNLTGEVELGNLVDTELVTFDATNILSGECNMIYPKNYKCTIKFPDGVGDIIDVIVRIYPNLYWSTENDKFDYSNSTMEVLAKLGLSYPHSAMSLSVNGTVELNQGTKFITSHEDNQTQITNFAILGTGSENWYNSKSYHDNFGFSSSDISGTTYKNLFEKDHNIKVFKYAILKDKTIWTSSTYNKVNYAKNTTGKTTPTFKTNPSDTEWKHQYNADGTRTDTKRSVDVYLPTTIANVPNSLFDTRTLTGNIVYKITTQTQKYVKGTDGEWAPSGSIVSKTVYTVKTYTSGKLTSTSTSTTQPSTSGLTLINWNNINFPLYGIQVPVEKFIPIDGSKVKDVQINNSSIVDDNGIANFTTIQITCWDDTPGETQRTFNFVVNQ